MKYLVLLVLLLAACTSAPKSDYDCLTHAEDFSAYFEEKEFMSWCKDCLKTGIPGDSYDVGPFCNTLTADNGKACSDRAECEGYCVGTAVYVTSGTCSATVQLDPGCHWLLQDGEASEMCFD